VFKSSDFVAFITLAILINIVIWRVEATYTQVLELNRKCVAIQLENEALRQQNVEIEIHLQKLDKHLYRIERGL